MEKQSERKVRESYNLLEQEKNTTTKRIIISLRDAGKEIGKIPMAIFLIYSPSYFIFCNGEIKTCYLIKIEIKKKKLLVNNLWYKYAIN